MIRTRNSAYRILSRLDHTARHTVLIFLLLSSVIISGCSRSEKQTFTWGLMGTHFRVTLLEQDAQKAQIAALEAFRQAELVDSLLSIYNPISELTLVNLAAGKDTFSVSLTTFDFLRRSTEFCDLTDGAFDLSVGPLMRLWKLRAKGRIPEQSEIDSTLKLVGLGKLHLDESKKTVFLPRGMILDSGGIAKGYAADLARTALKKAGATDGMVDLGGNLALFGSGPSESEFWRIGIRNPVAKEEIICSLDLTDVGLATSGQYEQYFIEDGKRYGHLLDPRTGRPADGMLSATIIAPDATSTDALSTGVFVLGPEKGMRLIEGLLNTEAILVLDPGAGETLARKHVLLSSGLKDRVIWELDE